LRKNDYILCYDISDQKRLVKLARFLEKEAIRIQYSIFFLPDRTKEEIYQIADKIVDIIDPKSDDVRIYKVEESSVVLGDAYDLDDIFIIK